MKPGWKVLNSKQVKELKKRLEKQFGYTKSLDYAFFKTDKNRVYIVNRDLDKIDFSKLRINSIGVYFCEDNEKETRLSIEGSQIVGPHSTKSVIEIDDKKAREWLKGFDLDYPGAIQGFVIVKSGKDFLGCAKHKENKLLNHVPKARRIRASD